MGRVSLTSEARFGVFRTTPGMVLVVLLVLLVATAVLLERDVGEMTPSEVSFLLAGHSLAYDFDFRYAEEDRSRGRELGLPSESVAVRSRASEGARFDLPIAYPLVMAPWVRVAPLRGPVVLNALLVCLAALVAAYRLGRLLGRDALALVAVCLFASVMYRNAFLVQPTSLLMALVALAFSLVLRHEEPASHGIEEIYRPVESPVGGGGRNFVIGSLVGVAATIHPLFLLLVLPAAVLIPARCRRSNLFGLFVGLVVTLMAFVFARPEYFESMLSGLAGSVDSVSVGATTWNLLYFAVGRNTGLLLYSLPFLALFGLWQGGARRSVLALTAIVGMLAPVALTPFNYYGGPAAVGNAWAFPWFVLLLFLPTGHLPRGWLAATVLLAAPVMYPTWLAPDIEPVTANGVYRQTAGRFHRWLPLETTQKELPPRGQASGQRLWIRSTSREAQVQGSNSWKLAGRGWAELQIATPTALRALHLQFGAAAEPDLELRGGDLGDTVLSPSGGIGFRVENLTRKALHPMWWSGERHHNYVLQLRMPKASGAQTLTVTAIAEDVVKSEP